MAEINAKPLIAIVGPTASGKSALALEIGQRLPIEIIGCDSVQVYRGFDIGSSKPSLQDQEAIPHHVIDILNPEDDFHAGLFVEHADKAIEAVLQQEHVPLVVGGTGLYLRALLHGLTPAPRIPDAVRDTLQQELEDRGIHALHEELREADPTLAEQLPPTDTQRILRGLAIFRTTGEQLSALQEAHQFKPKRYKALLLAMDIPRATLYEEINARVLRMMEAGLRQEVRNLMNTGVSLDSRAMQAPGYKELVLVEQGEWSEEEAISKIQQAHRRYAKRQFTWFRGMSGVEWVDPKDPSLIGRIEKWWEDHSVR